MKPKVICQLSAILIYFFCTSISVADQKDVTSFTPELDVLYIKVASMKAGYGDSFIFDKKAPDIERVCTESQCSATTTSVYKVDHYDEKLAPGDLHLL